MSDNNKPTGWGQNKKMPDSWGKGSSSSPWGQKQDKPASWGGNNSSPELGEKESVPPAIPSPQETVATEQPETPVYQETVETDSTVSLIKEEAPVQADETVISDENDNETPEPFETALPDDPQYVEVEEPGLDFAESEPEPEIMPPPVAPSPAPQNLRPVQQQTPQRPQYRSPEPSQSRYQQPYRNDSDYGYAPYPQPEKKSKTGVILGAIIVILLLVLCVFVGLFVFRKNDSKDSSSTAAPAVVTDAVTTAATTTTADNITSTSTDFAENTTTTTSQMSTTTTISYQIKRFPSSDINNYPQYINIGKELKDDVNFHFFNAGAFFELIDFNNDNIPEMVLSGRDDYIMGIYSIVNGKAVMILCYNVKEPIILYEDGTIRDGYHTAMDFDTYYSKYYGGDRLTTICHISGGNNLPSDTLLIAENDNEYFISYDEAKSISESHGNELKLNVAKLCDVSGSNSIDAYNDTSNLKASGKVTTQSTSLNMRESPSADADIKLQIPKDSYVGIVSFEGKWYYIKYYKDTSSPIYYGYVHSDYITITQWYD